MSPRFDGHINAVLVRAWVSCLSRESPTLISLSLCYRDQKSNFNDIFTVDEESVSLARFRSWVFFTKENIIVVIRWWVMNSVCVSAKKTCTTNDTRSKMIMKFSIEYANFSVLARVRAVCNTRSLYRNENAYAEQREGCRNSEFMKVLKCKGHKIYLKVKYESSGVPDRV